MPSVRIGWNAGNVIIVDGVAYEIKDGQPTPGTPTGTPTISNIAGFTWAVDDSNIPGGSNHRVWTACEVAIAGWGSTGGTSHRHVISPVTNGIWYDTYVTPSAGVIRVTSAGYFEGPHMCVRFNGGNTVCDGQNDWRACDWDSCWPADSAWNTCPGFTVAAGTTIGLYCYAGGPSNMQLRFLPQTY
jgi:hypothetical protein